MLVSGLDERGSGGLFAFDGSRIVTIDRLATTGIAVSEKVVGRLVQSFDGLVLTTGAASTPASGARLLIYDHAGVREFRRLDDIPDPHDLTASVDGSWLAVSSARNAVVRIRPDGSSKTLWQPSSVPDAWHVNCVCVADGEVWVTAFGRFEHERQWSVDACGRGFLRNLTTGEELGGLSHPHSPRLISDQWWVCNSLEQSLVRWSGDEWETLVSLRGYPRGLAVEGDLAFVGESAHRDVDEEWATLAVVEGDVVVDRLLLPCAEVYDIRVCQASMLDGLRRGFNMTRSPAARAAAARTAAVGLIESVGDPAIFGAIGARLAPGTAGVRVRTDQITTMEAGERRSVMTVVENLGAVALASISPFPVHLSYRWLRDGDVVAEGERTVLGETLFPGRTAAYEIDLCAPASPGQYTLSITLVQEGNFWFDDVGDAIGTPCSVEVAQPAWGAARSA